MLIVFFLVQYTNAGYPLVGHDYRLFLTRLLDSHLYYKANGLGIEWYTPNFGGGLPAYPNPLQMQFSLPQLVTWFVNPYDAIFISTAIYIAIGFLFTCLFLNKVLGLKPFSAILGADFFLINGFLIERVGGRSRQFPDFSSHNHSHLCDIQFQTSRLARRHLDCIHRCCAGLFRWGIYCRHWPLFRSRHHPVGIFPETRVILLAKDAAGFNLGWSSDGTSMRIETICNCINICDSFLEHTHDQFGVNWITGLFGMLFQLAGTMNWYPILGLIHKTSASYILRLIAWTKTPYGFWELDSSVAPGLLFLLFYGVLLVFLRRPRFEMRKDILKKVIATIMSAIRDYSGLRILNRKGIPV